MPASSSKREAGCCAHEDGERYAQSRCIHLEPAGFLISQVDNTPDARRDEPSGARQYAGFRLVRK